MFLLLFLFLSLLLLMLFSLLLFRLKSLLLLVVVATWTAAENRSRGVLPGPQSRSASLAAVAECTPQLPLSNHDKRAA